MSNEAGTLDCTFDRHADLVLEVIQAGRPLWTEKAAHLARLAGEVANVDGVDVCPFAGMPEAREQWLLGWRWMAEIRATAAGVPADEPAARPYDPAANARPDADSAFLARIRRKYVRNPGIERGAGQDDDA